MERSLTPALEDYLRAVMELAGEKHSGVRISDIARKLDIAKPSVIQAISDLKKRGLVTQEPYSSVYLTPEGVNQGSEVIYRHQLIRTYLEEILFVTPVIAERDACRMEHIISNETFSRMEQSLREKDADVSGNHQLEKKTLLSLAAMKPGQKARVKKLEPSDAVLRRRLMDMGLVPGAEVLVERMAPLGDPIEIQIKGFHLSLRHSEAATVIVEAL